MNQGKRFPGEGRLPGALVHSYLHPSTMSFSATILFSPPSGSEARCCCCSCKSETSQGSTGSQGGNPPASTPITVTGHGLAVQGSEQLLHIIYQRVDKAVGLAEAALGLARANNELLKQLQEEVGELRQGKVCTADEDAESRARSPPPEEPGVLKGSPGEACKTLPAMEEECDSVGSGVQVVIEELRQLGAASTVGQGPLGFFAAPQRDARLPGCTLAAVEGAPLLNPVSKAQLFIIYQCYYYLSVLLGMQIIRLFLFPSLNHYFICNCDKTEEHQISSTFRGSQHSCFHPEPFCRRSFLVRVVTWCFRLFQQLRMASFPKLSRTLCRSGWP